MKVQNNKIIVSGKSILLKIEELNIFDLKYWRNNPRIDSIIKEKFPLKKALDEDIQKELWRLDSVKELYQDIKKNQGLIDEIIVKDNLVLEGNSRLCAYRHLYKNAKDKVEQQKWSKIRARIVPSNTINEDIFTMLGTWHIKGKTKWRSFERASYIYRLYKEFEKDTDEISDMVKLKPKEVRDLITTYETMKSKGITETKDQSKFSAVYEIIKSREIKIAESKNPGITNKCIEAVKDNKFELARDVRELPKIIKDKSAKKAFFEEGESFKDSLDIAKSRHPEHEDTFYSFLKRGTKILNDCPLKKLDEIKADINSDSNKMYLLERFHRAVNSFCKKLEIKKSK